MAYRTRLQEVFSEDLLGRLLPCILTALHSLNAVRPEDGARLKSTSKRAEVREAPA